MAGIQNQQLEYMRFGGFKSEAQCWLWVPLTDHKSTPSPTQACLSQHFWLMSEPWWAGREEPQHELGCSSTLSSHERQRPSSRSMERA